MRVNFNSGLVSKSGWIASSNRSIPLSFMRRPAKTISEKSRPTDRESLVATRERKYPNGYMDCGVTPSREKKSAAKCETERMPAALGASAFPNGNLRNSLKTDLRVRLGSGVADLNRSG